MKRNLTLVKIGRNARLDSVLAAALGGLFVTEVSPEEICRNGQNQSILFAVALDQFGPDPAFYQIVRSIRQNPFCMENAIIGMIVDGPGELYTKEIAQELALSVNMAGGAFPGKSLIEGTGSLYNQHIQAERLGLSLMETYEYRVRELARRLEYFELPRFTKPRLLMLHASSNQHSNTLWMGRQVVSQLPDCFEIKEMSLQNGTIHDCRGCSFEACRHFAENNTCFYGGHISDSIMPAILKSDVLLCLCPNYNDSVGANMMALFNRLTNFLIKQDLYDKYLYSIIVSGYSGSDLLARQLLGTMCFNKTAMLPPRFALMQTANDPDSARHMPDIDARIHSFAQEITDTVKK